LHPFAAWRDRAFRDSRRGVRGPMGAPEWGRGGVGGVFALGVGSGRPPRGSAAASRKHWPLAYIWIRAVASSGRCDERRTGARGWGSRALLSRGAIGIP